MKTGRSFTFVLIILFSILVNIFPLFNLHFGISQEILSFVYLMSIPGILIYLALKLNISNFWERFVYVIGFSISFLMLTGLLINSLLPYLSIINPLSYLPATLSIHSLLLLIGIVGFIRNPDLDIQIKFKKLNTLNIVYYIVPLLFPILSGMGATSINNGGTNIFTMILLGSIVVYVVLLIIYRKKLNPNIYPYSLFFISLSVLLMTSLRGWYTTGHDNQQEYYVFLLTDSIKYWNLELFRDTYNACLSLNIFPTLLSSFMESDTLYIFKLYFQLIFSVLPIAVYVLIKNYTTEKIAYLSALFIIAFPTFGNDMPMLNRQEIALIFFALAILILLSNEVGIKMKNFLFILFSVSIILAHYSTSYIATALFTCVYFLSVFLKIFFKKGIFKISKLNNYNLSFVMIFITVLFTLLWNAGITKTTRGFEDVMNRTVNNIGNSFNKDLKSSDTRYSIFDWSKPDKADLLRQHVEEQKKGIELSEYKNAYFDKSIVDKFPINLSEDEVLNLTKVGSFLSTYLFDPFQIHNIFKQGSAKLIQLLILIGFVIILVKKSKLYKSIPIDYLLFSLVSIGLLALFTLLPVLSNSYGTLRFFLQTLLFLSFPLLIGLNFIFEKISKQFGLIFSTGFIIIFFLSLYGFIPQLTGGFYPTLNLNNQGFYYDVLYTHKSDLLANDWLMKQDINGIDVKLQTSGDTASRLVPLGTLRPLKEDLPSNIEKASFVLISQYLNSGKKSSVLYKGYSLVFDYPLEFLNENKNRIYNNSEAVIYK